MTPLEQARVMAQARHDHRRPASTTNVKLAMDYFKMSNNEAIALCKLFSLHHWGFHTDLNKMTESLKQAGLIC